MTKKIMLSMALLGSTFLMGCSQQSLLNGKDSISATSIQGIEQITQQSDTQFDVVCPTGICRFELTTKHTEDNHSQHVLRRRSAV
ncbi:hypothetical protein P4S70_07010 [Enterovibrio sp. Hal110]